MINLNYNQKIQKKLKDFTEKYGDVYEVVKHYARTNTYNNDIFKRFGERNEIWKSIKEDSDIYRYLEKVRKMVFDDEIIIKLSQHDDFFNAYIDISNAIIAIEKSGTCFSQIKVVNNRFLELEIIEVEEVLRKAGMVIEKIKEMGTYLPLD